MKKLLISTLILVFAFSYTNAQESTFNLGDKVINLGLGLGSTLYSGTYYNTTFPPVSASFEYGIKDEIIDENGSIGIGAYMGYTASKWESSWLGYNYGYNYSSFILGARGSFHYAFIDKFDTYAGIMLGYNVVTVSEFGDFPSDTYNNSSGGLAWSMYLGGRYYFSPKFAGMLELGYGISYLNIGIALKL